MRHRLLFPILLLGLAAPALGQPTVYFQQLLDPTPLPDGRFGAAVALGGDRVAVGVPGVEGRPFSEDTLGAAFVFLRDPNDSAWTLEQELEPTSIEGGGEFAPAFGAAVAIDGMHAVVGAPYESGEAVNSGAAFLFRFDEETDTWVQFDKFKAPAPALEDQFGYAVAISGGIAVVGAFGADEAGDEAGAAYVFLQETESGAWDYFQTLTADDAEAGDRFGSAVAVDGHTIVVGRYNEVAPTEPGAAYVFERTDAPDDSTWAQVQKLQAGDAEIGDGFGFDVAVSPEALLVGAPFAGVEAPGAAYLFERDDAGTWTEVVRFASEPAVPNSSFGSAVGVQDDVAVIGAPQEAGADGGAVYVFVRDGTWTRADRLEAPASEDGQSFGEAVAVNAGVIAVGSPMDDAGAENAGAAYLFGLAPTSAEGTAGAGAFALDAPHPNPFTTSTTLTYSLDEAATVTLTVYDVLGREVAVLEDGPRPAGRHTTRWAAPQLPAGVYVVRLTAGDFSATRKALLVR